MAVVQVFAAHAEVFPGLPDGFAEFERLVAGLSRTDALLWCGRINLHLGYPLRHELVDVQRALVDAFFEGDDLARLRALARSHHGGVQVFFRGQMLELIRWVSLLAKDAQNDGRSFEEASKRRDFVRAVLMASDIWARRVYPNQLSMDGGLTTARRRALESLRRSHTENSCGPHPWLNLARAALVWERIKTAEPAATTLFEAQTGLTLPEYFSALAYFMLVGSSKALEDLKNPDASGLIDLSAISPAGGNLGRICSQYLSVEAQSPDELRRGFWGGAEHAEEQHAQAFDLNLLRAKPILRARGGRAVIIDQVLMAERATAGPLFYLVGADRRRANDWFGLFGNAFEAQVLESMRDAFPPVDGPLQRLFINPKGNVSAKQEVELADAILLDANAAVFIELKAVWMNERTPDLVESPELFLEEVRRRYSTREAAAAKGRRVSGVGQLGRTLRRLGSGEWSAKRPLALQNVVEAYPVLLVYDAYLDTGVHARFLAEELASDLLGTTEGLPTVPMRAGSFLVRHLIVITIDEWELIEGSLDRFSFGDCLRDYDTSCPDRMTSFRDFLLASPYRDKLRYSPKLIRVRDRVLDQSVATLFPDQIVHRM